MKKQDNLQNSESLEIKTRLTQLKVLRFGLTPAPDVPDAAYEDVSFSISFTQKFIPNVQYILLTAKLFFQLKPETSHTEPIIVGNLLVGFAFELDGLSQFLKEDGKYRLPEPLNSTYVNIAYGTLRGIVATQFAGTLLSSALLPMTDSEQLLKAIEIDDTPATLPNN